MDHSIYGSLSRRSKEELERIIAMYEHLREMEYYKEILNMAEHFLELRKNDCKAEP